MNLTNQDARAYHLRNVRLSEDKSAYDSNGCTRAGLYAHKNLADPTVKIDEFDVYYTEGTAFEGVLWVEVLGLIQEY